MSENALMRFAQRKRLGASPAHGIPRFMPVPNGIDPRERSLIGYHRQNLRNGTYLDDGEGLTTLYLTGVTGPDGRIYNVPGYAEGRRLSPREAAERADRIGWGNFPSYSSGPESNIAAQRLHRIIEDDANVFRRFMMYSGKK